MTNDGRQGTGTQYVEPPEDGRRMVANLATDNRPESMANHGPTNWAWANGRSGYDWMDSHYLITDVA